jgi:hypothetical protein
MIKLEKYAWKLDIFIFIRADIRKVSRYKKNMLKSIENCKILHVLCDSNEHFIGILHLSLLKRSNQGKINIKAHLYYHSSFQGMWKCSWKSLNKTGNEHFKMGDKLIKEFFYD